MLEELRRHNAIVQERIMKSFGYADTEDFIQKGEDNYDLEKAHQDGDMHPNGKWVWVSSANGGKGDWRTLNGRAHKKHQETNGSNKKQENNNKTNHPQGGSGGISNQTLHNTLRELALTGTIRNLRGVSPKRRGEILDELEKRGFVDGHMQVTRKGTAWLSGLITETPEKPKANNVPNSNSMTTSTAPVDTTDKLKSVLAATDGVYDEEKRKSNLGAWERDIQKYTENVAVELGKQIGVPFRKNWQGETEVKLGEYSSKDGGSQVEVTLDYDRGIQTYVSHSMAQSAKRTRKGGMVMCIYYPGHGGSCKTINLTEADNAKLKNIVKALKDVNKVKIKDLKNVQGYNSEQKTYNLLVKTLKKYNI